MNTDTVSINIVSMSFAITDDVHGNTIVDVIVNEDTVRLDWTSMAHGYAAEDVVLTIPRSLPDDVDLRGCPLSLDVLRRVLSAV